MRMLVSYLIGIITAVVIVALGVLVALNGQGASLTVPGASVQVTMGWLVAAAVALGGVLAFLILIPGRLASAWQRWLLGQRAQGLERRLQALREQHAELQGSHRRLVEEHRHVMQQVLTPVAVGREGDAAQLPRTGPLYPDGRGRRGAERQRQVWEEQAREQVTPLDGLRARIAAMRVAVAAKLAGLRRADTRGDTPSTPDQGATPGGPGAAPSWRPPVPSIVQQDIGDPVA
jgi:hypothetical protein